MRARIAACVLAALAFLPGHARAAGTPALPNLQPLAPYHVQMGWNDLDPFGPPTGLRFSVATRNTGAVPLEVAGIPDGIEGARADQCVAWVEATACGEYAPVSRLVFHAEHQHYHFVGFAKYTLRALDDAGHPVMDGPPVAGGVKVSFCMADSAKDAPDEAAVPRYTELCPRFYQGIQPGWRDIYLWDLFGQQIDVTNVPDGYYALVVETNPDRTLRETSYEDNMAFGTVHLVDRALADCGAREGDVRPCA